MKLLGSHYLIFDTTSVRTERLKTRLMREGATVRITSSILVASRYVEERSVNGAFVPFRADPAIKALCEQLDRLRIPTIYTGSSPHTDALRAVA